MKLKPKTIKSIHTWLGSRGIKFFRGIKEKHGRINAVYMEEGIPHPVHFREGMQVRNFLRTLDECKDWDAHKLDDNWVSVIEEVLKDE